jgi:hypothetical protein
MVKEFRKYDNEPEKYIIKHEGFDTRTNKVKHIPNPSQSK